MGLIKTALVLLLSCAFADNSLTKKHLMFLMSTETTKRSIEKYRTYVKAIGKHDFEVLEHLGSSLLEQGMQSNDPESQMLSLYGAAISNMNSVLTICNKAMSSQNPGIQIAALHVLGQMQDDQTTDIICKAFSSPFLPIRMEASYVLASRRHPRVVGYLEGLRQKLPPQYGSIFPDLLALVGNAEAIAALRHLFSDQIIYTRLASILSVAKYGRDDLLKEVRCSATHLNLAEQEAAAFALGQLGDSHSLELLHKLANAGSKEVVLSASFALFQLGEQKGLENVLKEARDKNLFAIALLAMMKGGEDTLFSLLQDADRNVRFNSAVSLLRRHDPRCRHVLFDMLISNRYDIGFEPHPSPGHSMSYWKVITSAFAYAKTNKTNTLGVSRAMRQRFLTEALELPEDDFLKLANTLFEAQQKDLVPLLVHLLINRGTEKSIALLKDNGQKAGAPFVRAYCNLALYRIENGETYKKAVKEWIARESNTQMIRIQDVIPKTQLPSELNRFSLDPEETSALLLESFEAIAEKHESEGIDIILDAIHDGNEKNRYALAGLLLKALQ
jgi:HEAT repeat protein